MAVTKDDVLNALVKVSLPNGTNIVAQDLVRAVRVEGSHVSFVIEAPTPEVAAQLEPVRRAAEAIVSQLEGVDEARVALTAHGPAAKPAAPSKFKGRLTPQAARRPHKACWGSTDSRNRFR